MPRRALPLALAGAVAVFATAALGASSTTRTAFADGSWTGSARLAQKIDGFAFSATSRFAIRVVRGRVTGSVTSQGSGRGAIEGTQLTMSMTGVLPMTGRAASPLARGTLRFSATSDGTTDTGTVPGRVTLTALRGTCARMSGKLNVKIGDASELLTANFVATRAGSSAC